jgi:hypothetical protein
VPTSQYQATSLCDLSERVFLWVLFLLIVFVFVPRAGVEPARPNGHMALNHACLPISAPGRERDSL